MKLRLTIDTKGLTNYDWSNLLEILDLCYGKSGEFSTDTYWGKFDEVLFYYLQGIWTITQLRDYVGKEIMNSLHYKPKYLKERKEKNQNKTQNKSSLEIERVIFNNPATIVFWKDGTHTIVKCQKEDIYNKEQGLALCIVKKVFSNKGNFNEIFKKWCTEESKED